MKSLISVRLIMAAMLCGMVLLFACETPPKTAEKPPVSVEAEGISQVPPEEKPAPETTAKQPAPESVTAVKVTEAAVMAHVPEGFEAMDWSAGDLNGDAHEDAVLIAHRADEKETSDVIDHPTPRPVLLLTGDGSGQLKLAARNDNLAMCVDCGGVFGDPHDGITVKNGYFSIEHFGGSNWRWSRIMTFRYHADKGNWFLHKDGGDSFNSGDPENVETKVLTTKDFGEVAFEAFQY